MASVKYPYTNLTAAIRDKESPLRAYLEEHFPNVKPLQAAYRAEAGRLLVPAGTATPGTLGAAFDYVLRFLVDPGYAPFMAVAAFMDDRDAVAAVTGVTTEARNAASGSRVRMPRLAAAAWALALCTEVYRVGLMPGSPLVPLRQERRFTTGELLALASEDVVRELSELRAVADRVVLPELRQAQTVALGPTFKASQLCAADADLVADGTLFEVKTRLGNKNRDGSRSDSLGLVDLYQLLAYVLFDTTDEYGIHEVAVYSARYGHLARWTLDELITITAARYMDLAHERRQVWRLLGGSLR